MADFLEQQLTLDNYWRSIILYGQNVASYKFALAKSLLELARAEKTTVTLEELAVLFSRHLTDHLRAGCKQGTSASSLFLETCKGFIEEKVSQDELIASTVKRGFNNVIDAFHVVNRAELPVRFYIDDRKAPTKSIRLTDDVFRLKALFQSENLPDEVEARWRLVETAWDLNISRNLITVHYDEQDQLLFAEDPKRRRITITSCRKSLNGYQKGKCFYCYSDISILDKSPLLPDVDHFFPHTLSQFQSDANLNGIWNLVLACTACNRGQNGKMAKLPRLKFLERLHRRNEYLIDSHHPLRETLILQSGDNALARVSYLNQRYQIAQQLLIHQWEPAFEHETGF